MPNLRGLADVANILLRDHLSRQAAAEESERVKQRQLEVAKYNKDQLAEQHRLDREATRLRQYGENPVLALTAAQSGDSTAEPFIETDRTILGPAFETISKAKNPEDLPSLESLFASRKPGIIKNLAPLNELAAAREAQTRRIADSVASEVDQAGATSHAQAYGQGIGKEEADAVNFPAVLGREKTKTEQETGLAVERLKKENPVLAQRAGMQEAARLAAEWNPKVVASKLDFEAKKAIQELALAGKKAEAEDVAKRNAAIKGLLPTYQVYRQLALDITSDPRAASLKLPGQAQSTISKVPWVGDFLASAMDTIAVGRAEAPRVLGGGADPEFAKKLTELNTLTTALAQGMANAVLGNRGQTTENDRRAAKDLLVSVFRDVETAKDLIAITDRMMTAIPNTVILDASGRPDVAASLEAAKNQTTGNEFPAIPAAPTNERLNKALEKLNAR